MYSVYTYNIHVGEITMNFPALFSANKFVRSLRHSNSNVAAVYFSSPRPIGERKCWWLQDGAAKIAKLPYKWLNYGLW